MRFATDFLPSFFSRKKKYAAALYVWFSVARHWSLYLPFMKRPYGGAETPMMR